MSDSTTEILAWLQMWFKQQSNGDWEHRYGVSIETLDNPGWSVKIDLAETSLSSKGFSKLWENHGENNWIMCRVENKKFEGAGDAEKLLSILTIFKKWTLSEQEFEGHDT